MATIATLFSGGEGVGVGARAADLVHLWGIEYDDAIANVARANGFHVITADIMTVDPHTLEVPDVLHASPVCKRASNANQSAELNEDGTKEAPEDIAASEKVAQFIDVMKPRIFTLENVYAYRNFKAFKIICNTLSTNGYMWDFDNLNAADYGVPQTRRRLILRAVRGALLPNLPQPERWVGWFEAIKDLIPGLPESQFAAWQLARLPGEIKDTVLLNRNQSERDDYYRFVDYPAYTVCAEGDAGRRRAFIVANGKYDNGLVMADESAPTFTVTANSNQTGVRAWLVSDQSANAGEGVQVRDESAPGIPVRAGENGGGYPKAYLVYEQNASRDATILSEGKPAATLTIHTPKHPAPRAWLSQGRVVSMTPRALARFQSLPDSYLLPDNKKLACTVIGNCVPPLLYQKIIKPLTETL